MSGSMFYVPRRSQLPAFVPDVISSLFPATGSSTSTTTTAPSNGITSNSTSTNAKPVSGPSIVPSCAIGVPANSTHKAGTKSVSSPGSVSSSRFPPALCFPKLATTPELEAWKSQSDLASRTLQNLLRASHSIVAVFQPAQDSRPPSEATTLVEHLCAAYLLGAPASHLRAIFDRSIDKLTPWTDSAIEITLDDWQDYLGNVQYQRAYLDFFEDQLVEYGYDWRGVVLDYMFRGDEPLVNGATSSWGAALIRLALAYELDSAILAMQALTISACTFSRTGATLAGSGEQVPPAVFSTSIERVFGAIAADGRVKDICRNDNVGFDEVVASHPDVFSAYQDGWDLSRTGPDVAVETRFEEGHKVVAAAFVTSVKADKTAGGQVRYSNPLGTVLALSHAVRVMIPSIPTTQQATVLYTWWRLALAAYLSAGCPTVTGHLALAGDCGGGSDCWDGVRQAFASSSTGAHIEGDAAGLVAAVVSSSAEAGGRTLATGQAGRVDYQGLMRQMYEARCRREDGVQAADSQDESIGVSTATDLPSTAEPATTTGETLEEVEAVKPVWAEGALVTAAWSLRTASWEAAATNDRKGARLFEALAQRVVAQIE